MKIFVHIWACFDSDATKSAKCCLKYANPLRWLHWEKECIWFVYLYTKCLDMMILSTYYMYILDIHKMPTYFIYTKCPHISYTRNAPIYHIHKMPEHILYKKCPHLSYAQNARIYIVYTKFPHKMQDVICTKDYASTTQKWSSSREDMLKNIRNETSNYLKKYF